MSSVRPNCGYDCLENLGVSETYWDNACTLSAKRGHLKCLRYAHERGYLWNEETCRQASWPGHLECLRYAHEQGCPWDKDTCQWASMGGQLECLRYAHEQGCPWDVLTCFWASSKGHMECLRYALENGCPVPDFTKMTVNSTVVSYLHHQGFRLGANNADQLKKHIRKHVHRAWALLRCVVSLLGSHRRSCERVYSPDGVGYLEAEISFRKAIRKNDPSTPCISP